MRRVYQPPKDRTGLGFTAALTGLLALAVFLVLPLTQMASGRMHKELTLRRVDSTQMQAPETEPEPPPPPPPEEKPPEPPPQLAEAPPPMDFNVSLDVAVGSGGAMAMGFGSMGAGDGTGLDVFDIAELERRPEAIAQVAPVYPAELRRARVEGAVTLVFLVDEEGRVQDPRAESASHPEFERPALEAVRKWRFRPGMKDGEAVKTYLRLPMRFRVSGN